jgi:hypothetical protein
MVGKAPRATKSKPSNTDPDTQPTNLLVASPALSLFTYLVADKNQNNNHRLFKKRKKRKVNVF